MTAPYEALGLHEMEFRQGSEVVDPTLDIPDNSGVYGHSRKGYGRPEQLAPSQEDVGGFLFLPENVSSEFINQLVAVAGMASTQHRRRDQYALQVIDAPAGMERQLGYLRKIVIADDFALKRLFRIASGTQPNYPQPLDVGELVNKFIEDERRKYGTYLGFGHPDLAGKFGGDEDYKQEGLGFGFAIENAYFGVISVWSRGWLCTK